MGMQKIVEEIWQFVVAKFHKQQLQDSTFGPYFSSSGMQTTNIISGMLRNLWRLWSLRTSGQRFLTKFQAGQRSLIEFQVGIAIVDQVLGCLVHDIGFRVSN